MEKVSWVALEPWNSWRFLIGSFSLCSRFADMKYVIVQAVVWFLSTWNTSWITLSSNFSYNPWGQASWCRHSSVFTAENRFCGGDSQILILSIPCHLRWRVSKLIFAHAENKEFPVWQSEEPDDSQLPIWRSWFFKLCSLLNATRESKYTDLVKQATHFAGQTKHVYRLLDAPTSSNYWWLGGNREIFQVEWR